MKKDVVFGVLGVGRIGRMHAENLISFIPEARVKAIADINIPSSARKWAADSGIERISQEADDILRDTSIDAVLICSSTNTHTEFITRAAEAGKDIFCEKPIGSDVEEIKKALEIVKKRGVKFQIGFVRRFDHNFMAVKEAVSEGKIGKPEILKISSKDPECPPLNYLQSSGGIFFDMMIHDFDMACYLSGSEIASVYSEGAVLVDPRLKEMGDIDTAIVSLTFANGMIGVIENSRRAGFGYDQRAEIHGSLGTAAIENDRPDTLITSTSAGMNLTKPIWHVMDRYHQAFVNELKAFVHSVLKDEDCSPSGKDGLNSVMTAMAAMRSYREGQRIFVERGMG